MIGQLSENSIARRARVEEFRDAKVFPGLIGYHSEGSLASTEITITKKHDLKELAMKRKMSMSGDISLYTIFDPSLKASELGNINQLAKFRKEARLSRSASSGKMIVKYPRHKNKFRYTNQTNAKMAVDRKDPFRDNFKTEDKIWEEEVEERKVFQSKLLGPRNMAYGNNSRTTGPSHSADELDKFIRRHNTIMKGKKFGRVKLKVAPQSKRRGRFNKTFNRLMMSRSMSVFNNCDITISIILV